MESSILWAIGIFLGLYILYLCLKYLTIPLAILIISVGGGGICVFIGIKLVKLGGLIGAIGVFLLIIGAIFIIFGIKGTIESIGEKFFD